LRSQETQPVRLAVVTTPPSVRSGIGDYTRRLLPHLARLAEVELFVEAGLEGEELAGLPTRSIDTLAPRSFDQVLFQLGNERSHAFMVPFVRAIGGAVALHDWVLFDLAAAAHPALERSGWKGLGVALREGGVEQAAVWWRNRRDRRAQRLTPVAAVADPERLAGTLLWGWHAPEPGGRWTADVAQFRAPPWAAEAARIECAVPAPRALRASQSGLTLLERELTAGETALEVRLGRNPHDPLLLEIGGVEVTPEQRGRSDVRRLGLFVRCLAFREGALWRPIDLTEPAALPLRSVDLARDRFRLSLHRSVVRFADAFVVHSEHLARRIRIDRNAPTPIAVIPHGADPLWRADDRKLERAALGLPLDWQQGFLVTSFGGLQARKRLDVLLEAVAIARRSRADLRLALIGAEHPDDVDVRGMVQRFGVGDAVRITGHVEEDEARRWIHAGDLAVQLRGPSSGGTSGGLLQSLGQGRGAIASALDEQRELPDECVYKLLPGDGEAARLAQKLVDLRDSPSVRQAMEQAARDYVQASCRWELVAQLYAEALERFPSPRASRRSLLALRFRQAVRQGRERAAAQR
jgi:glycosyltransferase involved in cell wall biosynthesis